jgi:hypothetical protein
VHASIATIVEMSWGHLYAAALNAVAELKIADHLAAGPKTAGELSAAVNAHAPSLYRVLRALAAKGIFAEDAEGRFHLTPTAELLRTDAAVSLRALVLMGTLAPSLEAGIKLLYTVKTGETAFDHVHGTPFFEHLRKHPELGEIFDRGMASFSDTENPRIAASYDFSGASRVVDVGGGLGGLLVEVLRRNPSLRGVLFDRPEVVAQPGRIAGAGFEDRAARAGGDFFVSVPEGADVYMIKRILHDWDDERCVAILKNCRRAMNEGGRVLVIDAVVPPGNVPDPSKSMDLGMLALLTGRERTEAEFAELFAAAGLKLARLIRTPATAAILEGTAA